MMIPRYFISHLNVNDTPAPESYPKRLKPYFLKQDGVYGCKNGKHLNLLYCEMMLTVAEKLTAGIC